MLQTTCTEHHFNRIHRLPCMFEINQYHIKTFYRLIMYCNYSLIIFYYVSSRLYHKISVVYKMSCNFTIIIKTIISDGAWTTLLEGPKYCYFTLEGPSFKIVLIRIYFRENYQNRPVALRLITFQTSNFQKSKINQVRLIF